MSKRARDKGKAFEVGTGTADAFFARGRDMARRADKDGTVESSFRLTFEDPLDMSRFLTPARVRLIKAVRQHEDSVSGLARRLRRDPSSVRRDINTLEKAGLVTRTEDINPGHGRVMIVRPATDRRITFLSTL